MLRRSHARRLPCTQMFRGSIRNYLAKRALLFHSWPHRILLSARSYARSYCPRSCGTLSLRCTSCCGRSAPTRSDGREQAGALLSALARVSCISECRAGTPAPLVIKRGKLRTDPVVVFLTARSVHLGQ